MFMAQIWAIGFQRILNFSSNTFTIGAIQFVVQDAFDTINSLYFKCKDALSIVVNIPVDSTIISAPYLHFSNLITMGLFHSIK